jgi:ankyrin repeat protein
MLILSQDGMTPLHFACEGGHLEMVSLLLTADANIESLNQVCGPAID